MFIVTGDETGLVKLVDVKNRTYLRYGDQQSRTLSVSAILPVGANGLLSVHLNGGIESYTLNTEGDNVELQLERSSTVNMVNPVGAERIVQSGAFTDKVLLYNAQGSVSVYNTSSSKSLVDFTVKGPLCSSTTCNGGQVLFGGKENDARLYSVETQQEQWAAKNVSQDKLHLRVPVWNTCLAFRDSLSETFAGLDTTSEVSQGSSSVFYSGTAYRHVRMYDMKASHQPVVTFEIGDDYRVSSIQPAKGSDSDRLLYVADTAGFLTQWDMRMQRRLHTLKGAAGSIRKMTLSSDGQQLACVGLDRFLRTYDTGSNKMTSAVYLKNRLNTCLFVGDSRSAANKSESAAKKSSKGTKKGKRVSNEEDEDLLQELGAGDSSDGEGDSGSEGESDEGESGSGDEEEHSEGSDEEVEMDSEDSQSDEAEGSADEDAEEGESEAEGSDEDSEEEEEVVVQVTMKGKSQRAPAAAAVASQPKKARR